MPSDTAMVAGGLHTRPQTIVLLLGRLAKEARMTRPRAETVLIEVMRCFCQARDHADGPLMPTMCRALAPYGYDLLTPALLGLFQACETCLQRPLKAGSAQTLSHDERDLLALLGAPRAENRAFADNIPPERLKILDCATQSTRRLLTMVCGDGSLSRA